jgi:hypothetical protein
LGQPVHPKWVRRAPRVPLASPMESGLRVNLMRPVLVAPLRERRDFPRLAGLAGLAGLAEPWLLLGIRRFVMANLAEPRVQRR